MLGSKIRELRVSAGLTQERLAQMIGVTHASISQWERGFAYPRMGMIIKIAGVFGIEPSELVGGYEPLSRDEQVLLDAYRMLNARGRERLLEDARTMVASGLYMKAKNNQDIA